MNPDRILVLLYLLLAFLLGCAQIADADIWWHLRTGELILARGEIPGHDWFTYTNPGSRWIDLHWGFQLGLVGLWRLGGPAAVILATSAIGAATFAVLLAAARRDWPLWQSAACGLTPLAIFAGRYHPRPEMLTLLFLAVTLTALFHARRFPRLVWILPVVQLLWVNVQSLFVLGLVVWVAFLADALARRLLGQAGDPAWVPPSERDASEREPGSFHAPHGLRWGLVTLALVAATLANPYGLEGALFPLVVFTRISGDQKAFYHNFAGEFLGVGDFIAANGLPALFLTFATQALCLLFALGVVSFLALGLRGRFSLFRGLLFAAFAYLAWQANRNGALFAIVGCFVLRANVGDWWELRAAGPAKGLALPSAPRRGKRPTGPTKTHGAKASGPLQPSGDADADWGWGRATTTVCVVLWLLAIPTELFSFLRPIAVKPIRLRLNDLTEVPAWHAHDCAKFLGTPGMPQRAFAAHLGQAAVYLYHNGPERKVFADPRLEVNTREVLQSYLDILAALPRHDPRAEELLAAGGELPALIIDLDSLSSIFEPLIAHPRWRLVYHDDAAAVFLSTAQAETLGLPAKDPRELREMFEVLKLLRGG